MNQLPPFDPDPSASVPYGDLIFSPPLARPGALIALGLVSFLVGSLTVAFNAYWLQDVRQLLTLTAPEPTIALQIPTRPGLEPYDGEFVGPRGLRHAEREVVLQAIRTKERLGLDREEMLRRILAEVGRDAFADVSGPMTPEAAALAIKTVAVTPTQPDGSRRAGLLRIETRTARIDVDSIAAFCRRSDGRVAQLYSGFTDYDGRKYMTALAIQDNLDRLRSYPLTPLQASGLAQAMRETGGGGYRSVVCGDERMLAYGTFACYLHTADPARPSVNLVVLSNGYFRQVENASAVDPQTAGPAVKTGRSDHLAANRPAALYAVLDVYAAIALGLCLIVASCLIMADFAHAREILLIWCILKLAAAVLLGIASVVFLASISPRDSYPTALAQRIEMTGIITTIVGFVIQCAFPMVCLGILLGTQSEAYYQDRGAPRFMWLRLFQFVPSLRGNAFRRAALACLWLCMALHVVLAAALLVAQGLAPAGLVAGTGAMVCLALILIMEHFHRIWPAPKVLAAFAAVVLCAPGAAMAQTSTTQPAGAPQDPRIQRIVALPAIQRPNALRLEMRKNPTSLELPLQLLSQADPSVRALGADFLSREISMSSSRVSKALASAPDATAVLLTAVFTRDCPYIAAARNLLKLAPAHDQAMPMVRHAMDEGTADDVMLAIHYLIDCDRPNDPQSIAVLSTAYSDPRVDYSLRDAIARRLVACDPNVESMLLKLIDRTDRDLSSGAINHLGFKTKLAPETLAQVASRYPTLPAQSVSNAAQLLGRRDPKALEALLPQLTDQRLRDALSALIPHEQPQRANALARYLTHSSHAVQRAALIEMRSDDMHSPELFKLVLAISEDQSQPDYKDILRRCADLKPLGPVLSQRIPPIYTGPADAPLTKLPRGNPQPWPPAPAVTPPPRQPASPGLCESIADYSWLIPTFLLLPATALIVAIRRTHPATSPSAD